jgi:hypothetical protein
MQISDRPIRTRIQRPVHLSWLNMGASTVRPMTKKQMSEIGRQLAFVANHELELKESEVAKIDEIKLMMGGNHGASTREASNTICDLRRIEKRIKSDRNPNPETSRASEKQYQKINTLWNRQDHVRDEWEEEIAPLRKKWEEGKLTFDEAKRLIKVLTETRRSINEDHGNR